jgi:hypothetical protein
VFQFNNPYQAMITYLLSGVLRRWAITVPVLLISTVAACIQFFSINPDETLRQDNEVRGFFARYTQGDQLP